MYDRSKFYQGEDIKFNFYIHDANNQKIDLAQFTDIVLYIYNPNDRDCSMIKVSKVARDGYIQLTLLDGNIPTGSGVENDYMAFIDSRITSKLPVGQYAIEINVTATDANLTDTRYNRIGKAKAFKLERSLTKWESPVYDPDGYYPYDHDRTVPGFQGHYDVDANGNPYGYTHGHHHYGGGFWPWMQ